MSMDINTSLISQSASELEGLNRQLTCAISDAVIACSTLKSAWSGEAGEKAAALFNELKSGCIEYQEKAVDEYISFMRSRAVEGYEAVENANKDLGELFK